MTTRLVALAGTISVLVVLGLASLDAQNTARTASTYSPPRTTWGDPDFQGVYTNSNEYATPLERPKEFEGKQLKDLSADEIARVRQQATKQAIAGLANGEVRGPDEWWLQILDLGKRNQPWLIVDPPDGHVPPLTAEAAQRLKGVRTKSSFLGGPFNGPEDLGMLERCISRSVPGSMIPVMYGNNYQIIQTPGFIVITYEIIHEARVIPLDGRPHVGANVRAHMGDPRGHWEGNSLVVETTNFTGKAPMLIAGIPGGVRGPRPSTVNMKTIERFTRVGNDRIDYEMTIEDPEIQADKWTISYPMFLDPEYQFYEYACHEDNTAVRNFITTSQYERGLRGKAN